MSSKPRLFDPERDQHFLLPTGPRPAMPTVRIEHPEVPGGLVINAEDFDPSTHVRFGESKDPEAPKGKRAAKEV
jgi:hypothetical protein